MLILKKIYNKMFYDMIKVNVLQVILYELSKYFNDLPSSQLLYGSI